jgi:hypothetical protein
VPTNSSWAAISSRAAICALSSAAGTTLPSLLPSCRDPGTPPRRDEVGDEGSDVGGLTRSSAWRSAAQRSARRSGIDPIYIEGRRETVRDRGGLGTCPSARGHLGADAEARREANGDSDGDSDGETCGPETSGDGGLEGSTTYSTGSSPSPEARRRSRIPSPAAIRDRHGARLDSGLDTDGEGDSGDCSDGSM